MNPILRTLSYRNFRLFYIGNGVSLIGTWMQQVAMSWLVYRLTSSPFLLGLIAFAGLFPGFILTPVAGVLSDRWSRHRILLVVQILAMLQAAVLSFLVFTKLATVTHIVILSIFLGLVNAFDIPSRQSLVVEMIDRREDLGNAIALNSALFNAARLLGPSLAGITIALTGEGICFVLNALSYLAVIATLLMMKLETRPKRDASSALGKEFQAGFLYAYRLLPGRSLILLISLVSLVGMPYAVLMPVFARDIFHGGAHTLGFLTAASGAGSLIAALYIASRRSVGTMVRNIPLATGLFGLSLIAFALTKDLWLALIFMLFAGYGGMVQFALSNTILQTVVNDEMRGRVMSFFAMSFMGTMPVGSLIAGMLADVIGAPLTIMIGGLSCIGGALLYERKALHLQSATPGT